MNDLTDQFKLAIAAKGLVPPNEIVGDGEIHRFGSNDKPSNKDGWYTLHTNGIAAGAFGDWREGFTENWCSKTDTSMTKAERFAHRERVKAMQRQREDDLEQRQQSAAAVALKRWQIASLCTHHGYLARKGVQPSGVKIEGSKLLIPMRETASTVHSLQTIVPDGTKMFMSGGRVKGCYFGIGKPKGALIVCEGYATGASIHEATNVAVAVAFNAGNLLPVATALHKKYPDLAIAIAADDDHLTEGNPGLNYAKEAALAVGGFAVAPHFPAGRPPKATDFNDLAALVGLDAVRVCFSEIVGFVC